MSLEPRQFSQRYQQLQQYVRWSQVDVDRLVAAGSIVSPHFPELVADFCATVREYPAAWQVITGGEMQLARLQQALTAWLHELFAGAYDEAYVRRRLYVGRRHVAIELHPTYTHVAMSRVRCAMMELLRQHWTGTTAALLDTIGSLNKLLDLDLAIIEGAYEREHARRQKVVQRTRMRSVLDRELNQAQDRVLQAERLAGIGQMITGLAHESRNALQRIQACAEMLELEVEGNAEALHLVHRIKLAQDHVHRLFEEVRGYAAPVNLDRSTCQLDSIWREAWELLLPQWEGRIAEIIEGTTDTNLTFHGDRFRLVQLFRILLENSLAACTDPVRIEITCRPADLGAATGIRVSVRDNGPGLNRQQREHIFEPFFTTKTKGTGLGLAIARRIVEAHGGQLLAGETVSGAGAELIVSLPHALPE